MSEAALVRKIIEAVRRKYPRAYVRKLADRFTRGLPDVLVVFPRVNDLGHEEAGVLFLEAKAEGGRVSAVQEAEHAEILRVGRHGCKVKVVRDVANVLYLLELMGAVP